MNKYKISEEEFHKVSLTRLANNPSSQSRYSGARLSAEELKERMDEPLKLFKGKLNAVVSLIFGEGDDSALDHMPTGIKEGHTLAQMIKDVVSTSAEFAGYLSVGEKTLLKKLEEIDKAFEDINKALEKKVDKKTYEDAIKQCLKRIDGEAGIEYAYAQRDGEGRLKPMSLSPTAESIALRGEGGRLKAGSPVEDDDVVTKEYADKTHYGASQIFASALKGSASGEAVALKDISPVEHNLGVRVESKNKINAPDKTVSGTTAWHAEKLGSYTLPNGTYTISCGVEKSASAVPGLKLQRLKDGSHFKEHTVISNGKMITSFTVDDSFGGGIIIFLYSNLSGNAVETSCTYSNIQVELGTTATPYTPYIADTSGVKLLVSEANLLSLDKFSWSSNCTLSNGVVTQINADTNTSPAFKIAGNGYAELARSGVISKGRLALEFVCTEQTDNLYFGVHGNAEDTALYFAGVNLRAGTYTFSCKITNATQGSISWKDMQIEYGALSDYKPYKEPIEYAQGEDIKSIAPCTTIMTDTEGVLIECQYNQDANKVVAKLNDRLAALEAAVISQ